MSPNRFLYKKTDSLPSPFFREHTMICECVCRGIQKVGGGGRVLQIHTWYCTSIKLCGGYR